MKSLVVVIGVILVFGEWKITSLKWYFSKIYYVSTFKSWFFIRLEGSTFSMKLVDSKDGVATDMKFENPNDEVIEAFGIFGKLQCKLCKEAMKIVEKEVNSHSSKVNVIYLIFQQFHHF